MATQKITKQRNFVNKIHVIALNLFSSATSEDGKDWPMISSLDVVYSKNHQNF